MICQWQCKVFKGAKACPCGRTSCYDMQALSSLPDLGILSYCRSMQASRRAYLPDMFANNFGLPEPAALAGLSHRQCMGRLHMPGKEAA